MKNLFICVNLWFNFFEMKKNKLAILLFNLATFSTNAFACTVVADSNIIEENKAKVFNLLIMSLIFFVGTAIFYELKKSRAGLIPVLVGCASLIFSWATSSMGGDCGFGAVQTSQIGCAIAFVCFLVQFVTWLLFREKSQAELS